jgi:hypothetical protein
MKKFVCMLLVVAMLVACCMSDVSAVNFMTKPVLGDGTSGNVLVWNIGDLEYTDFSRATINEDKTVLFRNEDGVAVGMKLFGMGMLSDRVLK